MSNPVVDLETVTTDELIDALKARSAALIVVIQPTVDRDYYWGQFSKGPMSEVLFLMEKAKALLMNQCLYEALEELKDEANSKGTDPSEEEIQGAPGEDSSSGGEEEDDSPGDGEDEGASEEE